MRETQQVAVIGSGSWATALVKMLLFNEQCINWYIRKPETIAYIIEHKRNPHYLSSVNIDSKCLFMSDNLKDVISRSEIIIFAIPSAFLKETLSGKEVDLNGKLVVSAIKGIIPNDNLTIAEYFNQYHKVPFSKIGIIAGPCHAEEVALERLSYLTIASKTTGTSRLIAEKLHSHFIKTVIAKDIYGTEYAAVLKNIYAIATGISHGLGYGDNFISVLISNAYREMKRFLDNTYPSKRKLGSSAYLGDLLVTAYSQFSRNRTFGNMIGKGYSAKSAMLEMNMIAEGYYSTRCIMEINQKFKVKMPIAEAVYNILYERISPSMEIRLLTEQLS